MPAIQRLLARWGFVKLARYGLVRTPDDRILSMHPAVVDDGAGGTIVGWRDGDVGMAERASLKVPPRPALAQPVLTTAMPVEVASEAPVDDDDWEWMIALARARADEVVAAPAPALPAIQSRPPSRTRPMPAVVARPALAAPVAKDPAASGEWPKTAPIGAIDYNGASRRTPRAVPQATEPPVTVIPVPTLPTVRGTSGASRLQPVVRTPPPAASASRRFADGTLSPETASYVASPDDTDPSISVGDRTTPGIALPRAAHTVALRGRPSRR